VAFLNARVPPGELIFCKPAPGEPISPEYVYQLYAYVYGLKQSARAWSEELTATLISHGFVPLQADQNVFVHRNEGVIDCVIAAHVDDLLISALPHTIEKVSKILSDRFEMKDLGELSWYLGVNVEWASDRSSVHLSQEAYINDLLKEYRMEDCTPRSTAASKYLMSKKREPIKKEETEWLDARGLTQTKYRAFVGSVNYLSMMTRPDIAHAVSMLSRFVEDPRREQWNAVKWLCCYLKGTPTHGILYKKDVASKVSGVAIVGWSDSDFAGDVEGRHSTSGYVFMMAGGALCWKSKKQRIVARSSAEAELVALDLATREALWLRKLQRGLDIGPKGPTRVHEDNEAAIAISAKHRRTQRTKHIDVQYFAVSDDVAKGRIEIAPVASADNVADHFTKALDRVKFEQFREMMGIVAKPSTVHV